MQTTMHRIRATRYRQRRAFLTVRLITRPFVLRIKVLLILYLIRFRPCKINDLSNVNRRICKKAH